jgi:AcrR family transcriptional regulator
MRAGEPLKAPPRRRPRRSHAERTAETRARIKDALVDSITELGFHRTTSAEISRRSGVSWGAAQHHFGDKNGILMAVLVDSFNRLVSELEGLPAEGASLEARVDAFVTGAWAHIGSPHYRCTFEILLNLSAADWQAEEEPLRLQTLQIWNDIWDRFFSDARLDRRRQIALQYYTIACLSGLAAMKRFEEPNAERRRLELGFLEDTLVRELGQAWQPAA